MEAGGSRDRGHPEEVGRQTPPPVPSKGPLLGQEPVRQAQSSGGGTFAGATNTHPDGVPQRQGSIGAGNQTSSQRASMLPISASGPGGGSGGKRTPAQLALQNVFARFVRAAELKVNTLMHLQPLDRELDLFAPIRPGTDKTLDCLLESVGSVAKHCPKLMIDSIMVWRKSKSEASPGEGTRNITTLYPHLKGKDIENILKERKSLVSNFILCRVLTAIIQRLTRETLPDDLAEKLEDMVFGQLRNADPDLTIRSVNRQANIDLFAELAGALSNIRFATVSGRFVSELSKAATLKEGKLDLFIRSMRFLKLKIYPMDELENTADFLQTCAELFHDAHSSRIKHAYAEVFVQLLEPIAAVATAEVNLPAWMKTVELIFPKANKMVSKPRHLQAALPLINTLLCVSRKDFFHKHWGDFTELCVKQLRDKLLRTIALSSITRLLWVYLFRCSETSTANVYRRIDSITKVLFPPNRRGVVPAETSLHAFVQIVYFICVRYPEYGANNVLTNLLGIEHGAAVLSGPSNAITASSNAIISTSSILMGEKGSATSAVPSTMLDDWTTNTMLTGSSSVSTASNMVVGDTVVNPERLLIALRAFLLLLADMEEALGNGQKENAGLTAGTVSAVSGNAGTGKVVVEAKVNLPAPPFPQVDWHYTSSYFGIDVLNKMRERTSRAEVSGDIRMPLSENVLYRMGSSMRDSLERFTETLARVAVALDNVCGWSLLTETGAMLSAIAASTPGTSGSLGGRRGSVSDQTASTGSLPGTEKEIRTSATDFVSRDRQLLFDLIHTYIDCLPRITPTALGGTKIVEMLSRYIIHADDGIRTAAAQALKRICILRTPSAQKFWGYEGTSIAGEVVRIAANTGIGILNERYSDILTNLAFDGHQGATWSVLTNYIALLQIWLEEVKESPKLWDDMEADWIVEEIESRGLLFLCSQVPSVRKQAIRILQFADQFERALKGRPMDDLEEQFPGLTKAEARRQTLRRQSRNDLRRQYTLQRNVYNAQMDVGRSRIGRIMEECGPDLVRRHYHDPVLAASTRSEHQKLQQQQRQQQYLNVVSAKDTLIHIAGSDVQQDAIIWNRCFPDLIKWCFQYASPRTLQLCLRDVCSRLLVMQASIVSAAEQTGGAGKVSTGTVKWANDRTGFGGSGTNKGLTGTVLSLTDEMVDQWKVYMVFACASIEITRATAETSAGHGVVGVSGSFLERDRTDPFSMEPGAPQRLLSKATGSAQPIASAHQLFQMVFPLLSSERSSIRQAAVTSLGAIHWLSYQTFLEDVQSYMKSVVDDLRAKAAMGKGENKDSGRKAGSSQALAQTAQTKRFERVRMELTHVLSLVADFVDHVQYRRNDSLMTGVITYIREMARFLSDADVQLEWDHQMLRYYYSGFIERFYDHLVAAVDSSDDGTNFSRESENMERYMPYDLRLGLFRLFEQWCGYGQYRGRTREREAKMMLSVLDQVKDIRERGALTSTMEEQRKALETASLKAMAALCKGPIVNPRDSAVGFEFKALVSWIDSIFASPDEKFHVIARAALEALLTHNRKNEQLLSDVVRQCYIGDVHSNVTVGYFMALVDIFVREEAYPCAPSRMCALALYKAGDPNLHIRRGSVRLLRAIENRFWGDKTNKAKYGVVRNLVKEFFGPPPQLSDLDAHMLEHRLDPDGNDGWDDEAAIMAAMALIDEEHATYEAAAIASSLPIVYKYAQAMVSARLASERGEMTHEMLSEMVLISELVANGNGQKSGNPHGVRDILIFMVPWVRNVELAPIPTDGALRGTSEIVMTNLFYLTVKYGDEYVTEIENLWAQLVEPVTESNEGNDGDREAGAEDLRSQSRDGADSEAYAIIERHVSTAVEYLLNVGVQKRNPNFVRHAKKVMVYLARTLACAQLVDALVERITPQSLVPSGISGDTSTPAIEMTKTKHLPRPPLYMADLEQVLIDMPKRPAFSKGQLACVLLVDLAVEVGAALRPHLPLLLHIIFVQLDHFITLICEQNRLLLINLIQSIVPRDVAGEHIDTVHAALSLKEGKRLWPYEDITPKNHDIESEHQLGALVVDVLDLLSVVDCDLVQSWGETALAWATSCPVRHVACRSLQIFRTLMPAFSQRMLGELLQRLANTLADPTEEIQGFALENIMTLTAMIDSLDGYRLILFPQFFWAAVACIHSPHEWEYLEGVRLLEKILKKLNLDDPSCRNILLINLPTKWRGQFTGLQSLLLRGLSSSVTEQSSLRLINSLVFLDDGSLVDTSNTRVLFTLLANLPRWMQTFEADPSAEGGKAAGATIEECTAVAAAISEFVGKKGHAGIARLMSSYAKQRFRSKEDFLRQFLSLIKDAFFPTHEVDALQFLMGLLSNSHRFYRRRVLAIIKFMLPTLDSCRPAFGGGGQPLLALNSLDEELIAPLLTILQTDLAIEALEVLDEALSGTIAIGESNLRLVFGGKSIYKIAREGGAQVDALPAMLASPAINNTTETVEDSGWRVKDFNATARVARYNMTGVASTCGGAHDLAGLGRKTSYSGGVADRDSGRGVRPSPTSNILVGGSTRERRGSQPDKILNDQSASGKLELWALDDVNGNLLDTLNDLNAFFGQDDNFEQDFEESGVIAGSQSQRNSAGFDGESISGIFTSSNSSLSTETVTGETVAKSRKVSLSSLHSEVSYSAESLGPALTRDTSMSSLFVNGILGDYDPFGNGHDEDDDDEVSTETSVDGRRHGRSMGHGRSASAALAPLPDTSIPGSTMTTPARRLLSQHGALAFVTFRIQTRYEQLVQDAEFGHWLRADLAGVLRVDSERVVLERVEAEVGANGGVLVTAAVKGEEEGGGGIESAAYAEELAALIVGGEEEGDEGKALYQGVVTYNVDKTWIPEILIGFMGITVPYLPEGLRYELPYRQQHRRDLKLQSLPSSPIPNPHPLTPPLEPTRTQPSLEQNQRTVLTAETAIEVFRIFPASFELVVQLLEDWLGFAGDLLSSGVRSKEIERLAAMVGGMRNVEDGNVYKPPLVGDGEDGEQALEGVAERLLAYQQVDPDYLQAFLDARQRHVTVMNSQVSGYLSRRHAMSELGDMSNAVERERVVGEAMELASQVVKLYLEVLQLEGLLERFLGVGQERRTREMAVARECCEVCVTIRTA